MSFKLSFLISIYLLLVTSFTNARAEGEYIVRFNDNVRMSSLVQLNASHKNEVIEVIPQLNVVVMKRHPSEIKGFRALGRMIKYVEQNRRIQLFREEANSARAKKPYSTLWGLNAIKAQTAWQQSKGEDVIVAISDTGVQTSHWNLRRNIWMNPGESGLDADGRDKSKNKIDDDGNGYVDDVHGWDFISKGPALIDNHYHGTHVAGTVAARDENSGPIAGVAPRTKIMLSTFLNSSGSGTELNGAKTILYAVDAGARIVNCSWGAEGVSQLIEDAVAYAQRHNVLVVAAAGNSGVDTDRRPHTPSSVNLDNLISVGASLNKKGDRCGFSNYGENSVDVAAPGENIRSTANLHFGVRDPYRVLSGTSMAAPHVSGLAALIWSLRPNLSYQEVRRIIFETAVPAKEWAGRSSTGGMIRADKAIEMALQY